MAQRLDLGNQPLLLSNKNGVMHYLTYVEKMEDHYFFSKTGESDIIICYVLKTVSENQLHYSSSSQNAQFIPDSAGRYKIIEISGGESYYYRESVNDSWKDEGHGDPSFRPYFVGFSDNQSLEAVQAINYLNEHIVEPVIYNSLQVDHQPVFNRGDTVINFEEYIKNELWEVGTLKEHEASEGFFRKYVKIDSLLNSLSGFVRFAFVVRENGEISHIAVDEINLNNPDAVPDICIGISFHILRTYRYIRNHRWIPGEKNGVPVAVRQFVTVYFDQ